MNRNSPLSTKISPVLVTGMSMVVVPVPVCLRSVPELMNAAPPS